MVLGITGALALPMGLGLTIWSVIDPHPLRRVFGLVYLGVGLVMVAGYLWLIGAEAVRRRWRGAANSGLAAESRNGMAMLVALLLLSLLTSLALQGLVASRVALRAAQGRVRMNTLRVAATDAAWAAVERLAARTGGAAPAVEQQAWPSGLTTRVTTRPLDASALPVGLAVRPAGSRYFAVTAEAQLESREVDVLGYACRAPRGDVSILAWVERP